MPETAVLDRPPVTGTGSAAAMPPGTERVESLVEGIGIAIFVTLAIGAAVILIRNRRSRWVTSWTKFRGYTDWRPLGAFSSEIMVACCVYTPEDDKARGVRVLMRGQFAVLPMVCSWHT